MGASYASETLGVPHGEMWGEKQDMGSATWGDMGRHGEKIETWGVPFGEPWGGKQDTGSATWGEK